MSPLTANTKHEPHRHSSSFPSILSLAFILLGAFISAFAIEIFFIPNNLIDGGTVGLAMIASRLSAKELLPLFLVVFTTPFVIMAYRFLGKTFVIHMLFAVISFSGMLAAIPKLFHHPFIGESLEVVVIGGAILGFGIGIIIRYGGCIDGTEILGLIINKRYGFTVGQTVFLCNIFVYSAAGFVFQDWHPPLMSLITYVVVAKIMDFVIVGLEETKSVLVISNKYKEISEAVVHGLGVGMTILYGRGGFSGESLEILYIITERLQLAELKDLIYSIDPRAFIAIENIHEVSSGKQGAKAFRRKQNINKLAMKAILHKDE